eukprot:363938-Chlamydomonas_euryale.AAC.9
MSAPPATKTEEGQEVYAFQAEINQLLSLIINTFVSCMRCVRSPGQCFTRNFRLPPPASHDRDTPATRNPQTRHLDTFGASKQCECFSFRASYLPRYT